MLYDQIEERERTTKTWSLFNCFKEYISRPFDHDLITVTIESSQETSATLIYRKKNRRNIHKKTLPTKITQPIKLVEATVLKELLFIETITAGFCGSCRFCSVLSLHLFAVR